MDFDRFEKLQVYYNKLKLIERLVNADDIQYISSIIGSDKGKGVSPELISMCLDFYMVLGNRIDMLRQFGDEWNKKIESHIKKGDKTIPIEEYSDRYTKYINDIYKNSTYLIPYMEEILDEMTGGHKPHDSYSGKIMEKSSGIMDGADSNNEKIDTMNALLKKQYGDDPEVDAKLDEHRTTQTASKAKAGSIYDIVDKGDDNISTDDLKFIYDDSEDLAVQFTRDNNKMDTTRDFIANRYGSNPDLDKLVGDYKGKNNIGADYSHYIRSTTKDKMDEEKPEWPPIINIEKTSPNDLKALLHIFDDELTYLIILKYMKLMKKFKEKQHHHHNEGSGEGEKDGKGGRKKPGNNDPSEQK